MLQNISAAGLIIPQPVFEYISSIGNSVIPGGERITWTLPTAAVPQGPIQIEDGEYVESGSFGQPTAANHNVYETYCSPLVSSSYIRASAEGQGANADTYWEPFCPEWIPEEQRVNENLLGWWQIEKVHQQAKQELANCNDVYNDNSILGRISYSAYVMNHTNDVMNGMKDRYAMKNCVFSLKKNSFSFVNKVYIGEMSSAFRLTDEYCDLFSPYSFGVDNANKSAFFGLKRQRTEDAPGCCITVDGDQPEGWTDTRNTNWQCVAPCIEIARPVRLAKNENEINLRRRIEYMIR